MSDLNRVLVFGSNGFLSSNIGKFLIKNKVNCINLSSKDYDLLNIQTVKKLKKVILDNDILIFTSFLKGADSKNIIMLDTLLEALKEKSIKKFIYLGSDAVYDVDKMPLDEDSVCNPYDSYGSMHLLRENMLKNFFRENANKLLLLRITSVYGSKSVADKYGPDLFINQAIRNQKIYLFGDGEEKRSHIYIKDFLNIIFSLYNNVNAHGILNIASSIPISFKAIANLVKKELGNNIKILNSLRTIPVVRKPYKKFQIFRFIYNFGKPINQIFHKYYSIKKLLSLYPNYNETKIELAIREIINEY